MVYFNSEKHLSITISKYFFLLISLSHGMAYSRVINGDNGGGIDVRMKDGGLLVIYNGEELILNKACSGGVVFNSPVVVDMVCTGESVLVRKSACYTDSEKLLLGSSEDVTCQNISSSIQSLHFLGNLKNDLSPNPTMLNLQDSSDDAKDTLRRDIEHVLEHNDLLEKRQVPDPVDEVPEENDRSIESNVNVDARSVVATTATTTKGNDTATQANVTNVSNISQDNSTSNSSNHATASKQESMESNDDDDEVDSGEPDTFSIEEESTDETEESKFPFFHALRKGENDQVVITSDFQSVKGDGEEGEISSENDDLGSWENLNDILAEGEYHPLPDPGTLEYDVVTGGLDKWFPSRESAPVFDSHVSLFKSVLANELTGGCISPENCASSSGSEGHKSAYSFLHKYQPRNETWYLILEQIMLLVDSLTPPNIIPNRISESGGGSSSSSGDDSPQYKLQFFHDIMNTFGYQMRSLMDEDVNVGMSGEDHKTFWKTNVVEGLESCRKKAEADGGLQNRISLAHRELSNCDNIPELEAIDITRPVWNDTIKNYVRTSSVINYTHQVDPNSYLPPHMARINPRSWIFGEVLWYAVQVSYAFCFKEFSETKPNAFMRTFSKMVKLFETDVVQDLWTVGGSASVGNLDVYENLLPFVLHSAYGDEASSPNSNDFRRLLVNLDKISYALHRESLLDDWMQRPQKRKGTKEKRGMLVKTDKRRRRRRQVEAEDYDEDSLTASKDASSPGPIVTTTIGYSTLSPPIADIVEQEPVTTVKIVETTIQSQPPPEILYEQNSNNENTENIDLKLNEAILNDKDNAGEERVILNDDPEESILATTTTLRTPLSLTLQPSEAPKDDETTQADLLAFKDYSGEERVLSQPTTSTESIVIIKNDPETATITVKPIIEPTTLSQVTRMTAASTTLTPINAVPSTTRISGSNLKEYEIWNGLAYCLVSQENDVKSGDWSNVKPNLEDLMENGLYCN